MCCTSVTRIYEFCVYAVHFTTFHCLLRLSLLLLPGEKNQSVVFAGFVWCRSENQLTTRQIESEFSIFNNHFVNWSHKTVLMLGFCWQRTACYCLMGEKGGFLNKLTSFSAIALYFSCFPFFTTIHFLHSFLRTPRFNILQSNFKFCCCLRPGPKQFLFSFRGFMICGHYEMNRDDCICVSGLHFGFWTIRGEKHINLPNERRKNLKWNHFKLLCVTTSTKLFRLFSTFLYSRFLDFFNF